MIGRPGFSVHLAPMWVGMKVVTGRSGGQVGGAT